MGTIVVTGAAGATGRRVVARLVRAGHHVRAVDRVPWPVEVPPEVEVVTRDVRSGIDDLVADSQAVVNLVGAPDTSIADVTRVVLEAADKAAVGRVVHRSAALVYGAWPTNPVPLAEDHAIRPNPGFLPAADLAEAERLVSGWGSERPDTAVTVLRPALVLDADDDEGLARMLGPAAHRRAEPPVVQYLTADDLAAAVIHVLESDLTGVYNVAPRGWIAGADILALGGGHRLPVPDSVRDAGHRLLCRLHLRSRPPSATPLLTHPWVIASDRLQATGWTPSSTSEEAVVAAREGSWWRELSPKRRQEVTLAGSAVALGFAATAVVAVARRVRRR